MATLSFSFNDKVQVVEVSRWTKHGKDRLYIEDRRGSVGYYDFVAGEFVIPREGNISGGWIALMKAAVLQYISEAGLKFEVKTKTEEPMATVELCPTETEWKVRVSVKGAYAVKDQLKSKGYNWDDLYKVWSLHKVLRQMKSLEEFDDWMLDGVLPEDIRESVEALAGQLPEGVKVVWK